MESVPKTITPTLISEIFPSTCTKMPTTQTYQCKYRNQEFLLEDSLAQHYRTTDHHFMAAFPDDWSPERAAEKSQVLVYRSQPEKSQAAPTNTQPRTILPKLPSSEIPIYRCRNPGCIEIRVTESGRDTHETQQCPQRPVSS